MYIWAKSSVDSFLRETHGMGGKLQFRRPVRQNEFSTGKKSYSIKCKNDFTLFTYRCFWFFFSNVQIDTDPTLAKSSEIILSVHHSIY